MTASIAPPLTTSSGSRNSSRSSAKAVRYRWDDERTLRRVLTLLERAGDRAGALRLYDGFARRLRAEFDVEPSNETAELVKRMRG